MTFTDNGNALNTVVVNSEGDAEYTTGTLAVGCPFDCRLLFRRCQLQQIVEHTGDRGIHGQSKQRPQVAVSAAVSTIAQGQTTTLTALVQTLGGGVAPTGSVTFMAGSTTLGSGTLSAFQNSYAVATYTITSAQSRRCRLGRWP